MRNERLRHRKLAKRKAQQKDFRRKDNINKNVPTLKKEEKVETYSQVVKNGCRQFGGDGYPKLAHTGYKTVIKKTKQYLLHEEGDCSKPLYDDHGREIGMIRYPMSRKSRASKKQLQEVNQ